jgi:NADH:ubiquinone oxidoreductase subunit H
MIFTTFHGIMTIISILLVGCFIFNTSFVYVATLRIMVFSIISDMLFLPIVCIFGTIDFFSFFSFKNLSIGQLYQYNIIFLGLYFFPLLLFIFALDGLRLPFDYAECESELVTGLVTEVSGVFFVLFSLYEINHTFVSSIIMIVLILGGFYVTLKLLIYMLLFVLLPKAFFCRIRMTNTFYLSIFYVYSLLSIYTC